ncbi:hypothetical protein P9E76_12735, partial [Schinkia azotoformans]|uniref:hypothetical protein n=1 Tax=Schinkia azotoformans TaxID=1454 RepID=UPI002DBFE29A
MKLFIINRILTIFLEKFVHYSQNKVGKPLSRLPPYQTVRALLRHTAYPYVIMFIKRMHSKHFASFGVGE